MSLVQDLNNFPRGSTVEKVKKVEVKTKVVCGVDGCIYATTNGTIKQHKRYVHGIDATIYFCEEADCTYKSKNPRSIKLHKASKHNDAPRKIRILKFQSFEQPGC